MRAQRHPKTRPRPAEDAGAVRGSDVRRRRGGSALRVQASLVLRAEAARCRRGRECRAAAARAGSRRVRLGSSGERDCAVGLEGLVRADLIVGRDVGCRDWPTGIIAECVDERVLLKGIVGCRLSKTCEI